jgi:hypothetical protein
LLGVIALSPAGAWAGEPNASGLGPMCADRPGKATPPCIVAPGHLQLEVGLIDWSGHSPGTPQTSEAIAAFEARFGLSARTEVELAWTPVSISHQEGDRQVGVGDLTLGARTALVSPHGDGLAVSIEPFVQAPTGTEGQGSGQWGGGVLLPVSLPVGGFSIGFTPAIQTVPADDGPGVRAQLSGALGASYGFADVSVGAELWGAMQPSLRAADQASGDLFVAWSPACLSDVQFDAGVNAGLTRNTPRVELSLGVAHRF